VPLYVLRDARTVTDFASPKEAEGTRRLEGRNICVAYDCLFPLTHGGAERWYRVLVDQLVASGATVTYITRRQWTTEPPAWTGVRVVAVSGIAELYDAEGTRRTRPAVAFGIGTFLWLVRRRREFDAVLVASFPFFSLLAIRGALVGAGTPMFVDYFEVWSLNYWRTYAGRIRGSIGAVIQRLCIGLTRFAQVFTVEGAQQLRSHGFRGDVDVLAGLLTSDRSGKIKSANSPESPVVLFVGRHVKHKGVRLLPEILISARASMPELKMVIVSDGPERREVENDVARLGLSDAIEFTGSVSDETLRLLFEQASCTIVPSLREGYGLVVAESVSAGTPVVVANNPENLATSLVEPGVNGYVVAPSIRGMSDGILAAIAGGYPLRQSTVEWSIKHAKTNGMDTAADEMVERLLKFARHRPVQNATRSARS